MPATAADAVAQTMPGPTDMPAPLLNFKGMSFAQSGAGWPPDPNGDVGPAHYVQAVNTSIQIFNKDGTTAFGPVTFNTLFTSAPAPCNRSNKGDPVVLYDRIADRWVITDFAWVSENGPFYQCVAVSKSSEPVSGGWWLYTLAADAAQPTRMNDYPKLAVWADGYYMSANMFDGTTGPFLGTRVWALNRAELINGEPVQPVAFDIANDGGLLPANLRGDLPPVGSPALFVDLEPPNALHVWQFHVDWATPSNSTFMGPAIVTVAPFTMFPSTPQYAIPQLASTEMLDQIDDRLMAQVQYRRVGNTESLWLNHTVASGGVAAVRWYEVRDPGANALVYQQGTYQPSEAHRWMASLAVDAVGNMAVGYSVSSATMFPSVRYAGRLSTDALGQLSQAEASVAEGTGAQYMGYSRWGDYTAMTIDPVDDCTFWYTGEYYETTGSNWTTRIGSFKYPGCASFPKLSPAAGASLRTDVVLRWAEVAGATYEACVDPFDNDVCDTQWVPATGTMLGWGAPSTGTYYWQVRATTANGTLAANGGRWWSFTVPAPEPPPPAPLPPAGAIKQAPADGATLFGQEATFSWSGVIPGALYRVCVDRTDNGVCDTAWRYTISNSISYADLRPGTYVWQVREDTPAGSSEADAGTWWSFVVAGPPDGSDNEPRAARGDVATAAVQAHPTRSSTRQNTSARRRIDR